MESPETPPDLLTAYTATLATKAPGTIDVYTRILRQFTVWLAARPGSSGTFQPDQLTVTALDTYLKEREARGVSISHRTRIKTVVGNFARYLIEEHGALQRNPACSVRVPPQPLYAPRVLDPDQRYVLRSLVERDGSPRSAAIFALGYWAGCRVSDIAWLRMEHTHVTRKAGWLHVGHKGGKERDIDLHNDARRPLADYLQSEQRDTASPFVFTSQRAERLTEAGIHHWFRTLKAQATKTEWELIYDIAFHDLRHDFAHRARAAGWSLTLCRSAAQRLRLMSQTLHFPDAVPTLFGDTLYLRELTEDDVPAWFERASDPESAVLAGDPIPESLEMGVHWLQRHRERFRQQAAIRWAIVPKGATNSVGTIGLAITSKEQRRAELGIVIGRASWGKSIGTSAAHLVTHYAFSTLGLAEIQAEVLRRNLASRRLLEKVGFQLLRSIPGDPHSDTDVEDCFLFVLSSQNRTSAEQRRDSVWS